jgi:formiminotetrahydrofolate cyclodeaminase
MENCKSYEELLEDIASKSPAPGGGSVAALSGAFGASLVSMVCNLTIGKKKFKDVEEDFKKVLEEAGAIIEELLVLSREDVKAFNEVMAAFKLDGEEKDMKLQEAYEGAANIPLLTARKCLRVLELADFASDKGNPNTITDAGVGALMAHAGFKGAVFNVRVNLKYIQDEDFISGIEGELDVLEKTAVVLVESIEKRVESGISK